jgi:hypothetical protein
MYRSVLAGLRAIDAWNAADEGPIIESVVVPDVARLSHGWEPERVLLQVREALMQWRDGSGSARSRAA